MIRIPSKGTNGQPMTFYHVTSDTTMTPISRHEFFRLLRDTPGGEEHVVPDFDAGITYFVTGEACAEMSRVFCCEADRERKRYARRYAGPGNTCRTLSLNAALEDETEYGDLLADTLSESVEEIVEKHCALELLRAALACLTEEDREYILARYGDDMDLGKLAERYRIDRRYASKKAKRIEERLRKKFDFPLSTFAASRPKEGVRDISPERTVRKMRTHTA